MSQREPTPIDALLDEAADLGDTLVALALLETAVQMADETEDPRTAYVARWRLMNVACNTGRYDKMTVAFTWCLTTADRNPEEFDHVNLIWRYKWIIENVIHFPGVARAQLEAFLDDFRSRCALAGYNDRSALFLRWCMEMQMGNLDRAMELQGAWERTRRDRMSDCLACECNRVAELHALMGRPKPALQAAARILKGTMRCGEIPHLTCATLLRCFQQIGDAEGAEAAHRKGYRLVRRNPDFIREQAWHIVYLVQTGQLEDAAAHMRRHLPWALEAVALDFRLEFLLATRLFLDQVHAGGIRSLRMRLPPELCPVAQKSTVQVKPLAEWITGQAQPLAAQFDKRNGNSMYSRRLQRLDAGEWLFF